MNILFLSEMFYPHGGGAELATYLYAKFLSEAKFNVKVVTNRFAGEPEFSRFEGFDVYRLSMFNKGDSVKYSILKRVDLLLSSSIRKLMRWTDIVYVPRFWFSSIIVAKAFGKPVITHLHDYVPICPLATFFNSSKEEICGNSFCSLRCVFENERKKFNLVKATESMLLNLSVHRFLKRCIYLSDVILCVSKKQRDILASHLPSLKSKMRVIYNPMPNLSPLPMDGEDFGYFGGSNSLKGFHVLLEALRYFKRQYGSSVVVHGTKFSDFSVLSKRLLNDLGFLTYGRLSDFEYEKLYRKIRAVVVPSIWEEPFGYVVTEAILRNKAVIASNIGGIPELVKDCESVFLFEAGDSVELSEKLHYLSELSNEILVALCSGSREIFLKRFSNKETVKKFVDLCYAAK